ncbi:hypothetical protein A9Q83_04140 [Alphaproteobacteria bacterium 46_93_T64]|nr:hypothetical protein A9Q83_04140 [Alphaproteobacteria bacterium 46_93_T64]
MHDPGLKFLLSNLFLIAVRFNQDEMSLNNKSGYQTFAAPLKADIIRGRYYSLFSANNLLKRHLYDLWCNRPVRNSIDRHAAYL